MLVSNLDVQQRFANGTQGRLLYWFPDKLPQKKKAISASCPDLTARFMKEASMTKTEMLADIDFVDVTPRSENINNVPGNPVQFFVTLKAVHKHANTHPLKFAFQNNLRCKYNCQSFQVMVGCSVFLCEHAQYTFPLAKSLNKYKIKV